MTASQQSVNLAKQVGVGSKCEKVKYRVPWHLHLDPRGLRAERVTRVPRCSLVQGRREVLYLCARSAHKGRRVLHRSITSGQPKSLREGRASRKRWVLLVGSSGAPRVTLVCKGAPSTTLRPTPHRRRASAWGRAWENDTSVQKRPFI